MKLLFFYEFLNESLKNAKTRFANKIDKNLFQTFVEIDKTPTKKYVEKIMDWYLKLKHNEKDKFEQEIEFLIQDYDDLVNKNIIKIKDINQFKNFEDFEEIVNKNRGRLSKRSQDNMLKNGDDDLLQKQEKELIKNNEAKLIFENSNWIIYHIKSYEASRIFGVGTEWCISKNTNQGQISWDKYHINKKIEFYFFISKKNNIPPKYKKIAIGFTIDGLAKEIRDILDKDMDLKTVYETIDLDEEKLLKIIPHFKIQKDFKNLVLTNIKEWMRGDAYEDDETYFSEEPNDLKITKTNVSLINDNKHSMVIVPKNQGDLPFKFDVVECEFHVHSEQISNFNFLPNTLGTKDFDAVIFSLYNNNKLKNFDNFDTINILGGDIEIKKCLNLKSLKNNPFIFHNQKRKSRILIVFNGDLSEILNDQKNYNWFPKGNYDLTIRVQNIDDETKQKILDFFEENKSNLTKKYNGSPNLKIING